MTPERRLRTAEHPYYAMRVREDGALFARHLNPKNGLPTREEKWDRITPYPAYGSLYCTINLRKVPLAMIVLEAFTGAYVNPAHIVYLNDDRTDVRLSNLAVERPLSPRFRGRPKSLTPEKILDAYDRHCAGESVKSLAKELRVSETTLRLRLSEIPT